MPITHVLSATTPDNPAYEIRPSHWNDNHAQIIYLGGNTAGASSISGTNIYLAGGPNATLSVDGQSIVISGGAGAAGNTGYIEAGTTLGSLGTVSFADSNGISFGVDGQTITAQHNAITTGMVSGAGTRFVQANATFAGTNASGTIASDGISVSVGNYITTAMASNRGSDFVQANATIAGTSISGTIASNGLSLSVGPYITTAMVSGAGTRFVNADAVFAGTSASGTIASNGLSISIGPYITTAAASNHSHGNPTLALTNLTGTTASASNGLTLSLSAAAPQTGISSVIVSDATYTSGMVSFSNQNNITIGSSVNGATQYIRLSVGNYLTTAMASNRGSDFVAATAAFAGTSASGTIASNGISISIGPYLTTAAASNYTVPVQSNGILDVSTATASGTATSRFAMHDHQHRGVRGLAASGTASTFFGDVVLYGSNNITLSTGGGTTAGSIGIYGPASSSLVGTNGISLSTNGSTISIMPQWVSSYENAPMNNAVTMTLNGASVSHAVAFQLPENGSFSFIRIPALMTTQSTTIATTGATRSVSGAVYSTWNAVVYSLGVGANSRSLQSVASGGNSWTCMNSLSIAVNGTRYSVTQGFSGNAEGAGTSVTTQYSISDTNYSLSSNTLLTVFSSNRFIDINFANSLSAGNYWLIFGYSSSAATNSAGNWSNCYAKYSNHYGMSQTDLSFGVMGSTHLSSNGFGCGSFSTAGGGTTNSIPISAISSMASNVRPYFLMLRSA